MGEIKYGSTDVKKITIHYANLHDIGSNSKLYICTVCKTVMSYSYITNRTAFRDCPECYASGSLVAAYKYNKDGIHCNAAGKERRKAEEYVRKKVNEFLNKADQYTIFGG